MSSIIQEITPKRKLDFDDDDHTDVKRNKFESITLENFPIEKNAPCEVIQSPSAGTVVNRREFRHVGPYILGPKLGHSAVESISQYLAKKENTEEFVQVKILHLLSGDTSSKAAVINESQAKMLLHTEFSLLSLLENESGVIKHHGMFSDIAYEEDNGASNKSVPRYTGKLKKRLVFVLDCVTSHEYSKKSHAFINLQQYLGKEKKLSEANALQIFYDIISVVENLHKRNIIHRDLKLGNIVLNKSSNKIIITNFCLGKYLLNEKDLLYDQRGSPAYISPDVLCGPHLGKPSDIWALGVVLFMMLCGRFPFYESTPSALFRKIRAADYTIPSDADISSASQSLIQGLLVLRPDHRLTATQVRERVASIIFGRPQNRHLDQFVPILPSDEVKKSKDKSSVNRRNVPAHFKSDQLVPQIDNQQSKRSLTKNCSVPLTPISQSFLRPSNRLSLQNSRTIRPMTQNEIGQVQFIIFNNSRSRHATSTNDPSNWQATIRFHNNNGGNSQLMTQQMRNLSLRNRRELGLRASSWHDFVRSESSIIPQPNNGDDSTSLRRLNVERERDVPESPPPSSRSQLSVDTIQPLLNLFNRMFCMSDDESRASANNSNLLEIQNASQLVPNASSSSSSSSSANQHLSIPNNESLERILQAINNTFIRGRVPQPRQPFIEFNGTLTEDLATKICLWLVTNYREHLVIQRVFNGNSDNAIIKVQEFLTRCGVETLTIDGLVKIKRDQSFELLLVVTYLLQASGYTHNYLFSLG